MAILTVLPLLLISNHIASSQDQCTLSINLPSITGSIVLFPLWYFLLIVTAPFQTKYGNFTCQQLFFVQLFISSPVTSETNVSSPQIPSLDIQSFSYYLLICIAKMIYPSLYINVVHSPELYHHHLSLSSCLSYIINPKPPLFHTTTVIFHLLSQAWTVFFKNCKNYTLLYRQYKLIFLFIHMFGTPSSRKHQHSAELQQEAGSKDKAYPKITCPW